MMEIIEKIEEITDNDMSGYAIKTNKQVIKLLICYLQDCCERFGYFMSEDNIDDFVGAELFGLALTDTALNEAKMKKSNIGPDSDYFEGGIMFVDIKTSKGVLQFVAYNEHNGYYGHEARIESKQLEHRETL